MHQERGRHFKDSDANCLCCVVLSGYLSFLPMKTSMLAASFLRCVKQEEIHWFEK